MEAAFNEIPLALFTTLAPLGAGAFVALAAALLTAELPDEKLKRLDRLGWIAVAVVVIGFLCSFAHLANPGHATGVLSGVGSSPLSNEIMAGIVFVVAMLVYQVLAQAGKLAGGARKGLAAVVAVLALVFAVFCGMAYMIDTIQSWNTPLGVLQLVGCALLGGAALGSLLLALAGASDELSAGAGRRAVTVIAAAGAVLAVVGLAGMVGAVGGMENAAASGAALVGGVTGCLAAAVICLLGSCACTVLAKANAGVAGLGLLLAVAGIFAARLVFYALELSVGIVM